VDRVRIICSVYDPNTGRYRTNYSLYFDDRRLHQLPGFFLGWIAWSFTQTRPVKARQDSIRN
jgi:hypothetical protein